MYQHKIVTFVGTKTYVRLISSLGLSISSLYKCNISVGTVKVDTIVFKIYSVFWFKLQVFGQPAMSSDTLFVAQYLCFNTKI